jgi:predicted Mrr-cat superfamily restriction endonuclease
MITDIFKGTDKEKAIPNFSSQFWTFVGKIKEGDYIVMPMIAKAGHVAIGRPVMDVC